LRTEYLHQPVLLAEVLDNLSLHQGSIVVDCTVGGGGHARSFGELIAPGGLLIGLDVDVEALKVAEKVLARFGQHIVLLNKSYKDLDKILLELGVGQVDAVFFDLGLSSIQIENASRGFSYLKEGPLDMRYNRRNPMTASMVVNGYKEAELVRVFREYGEERKAKIIAREIVKQRERKPFQTTVELAEAIKKSVGGSPREKTASLARCFQAIRIEVNRELEGLGKAVEDAVRWLKPGGRIAVISYHSLEDRAVKEVFRKLAQGCICPPGLPYCRCGQKPTLKLVNKKAIRPTQEEIKENPRARSARLRIGEKI